MISNRLEKLAKNQVFIKCCANWPSMHWLVTQSSKHLAKCVKILNLRIYRLFLKIGKMKPTTTTAISETVKMMRISVVEYEPIKNT